MIRTRIIPQKTDFVISVPPNYVGRQLEIFLYALDELNPEPQITATMADFWGKLSDESAQKMRDNIERMRN
jgi:hypothetical protein